MWVEIKGSKVCCAVVCDVMCCGVWSCWYHAYFVEKNVPFSVLNEIKFRSGELGSEYEKRRQDMQQAEEDTTFNYQKKKVTHNFAMVLDMIL